MSEIIVSKDFSSRVQSLSNQKPIDEILSEVMGVKWHAYRKRWKSASSRELVTDFPLFVLFEDQYVCNLKCKMCIHGSKESKEKYAYKGKLSFESYCKLIDECAENDCPSICMNNINEPMLEKDIFDRINYASTKGILDIHMNTNATLLTKEKSEELLESGLTRLLIGFDGYTKEEYEAARVGAKYDEVLTNINRFLDLKKISKKKLPVVRISIVKMGENTKSLDKFIEHWLGKVDYVGVQTFYPFDEKISQEILKTSRDDEVERYCTSPWERVTVQGDGTVLPCCNMSARDIEIGNINRNSLHEIWNSEKMKKFREKHLNQDFDDIPVCKACLR